MTPKPQDLLFKAVNATRLKQAANSIAPLAHNLCKATMTGSHNGFQLLSGFKDGHREALVATTWDDHKTTVADELPQLVTTKIPRQPDIGGKRQPFSSLTLGSCKPELHLRQTPRHIEQQVVALLIAQPPQIAYILTRL